MTILTATSGDTGARRGACLFRPTRYRGGGAYPRGRISPLQEKLFCTLGGNVRTVAVDADFDTCQRLVKQAFEDEELKPRWDSTPPTRSMLHVCGAGVLYFEAAAAAERLENLVFSVPSGNFGNVTAGLMARAIGLTIGASSPPPTPTTRCQRFSPPAIGIPAPR